MIKGFYGFGTTDYDNFHFWVNYPFNNKYLLLGKLHIMHNFHYYCSEYVLWVTRTL